MNKTLEILKVSFFIVNKIQNIKSFYKEKMFGRI